VLIFHATGDYLRASSGWVGCPAAPEPAVTLLTSIATEPS
jgi:hypothetical protein